jgi:signal transduction histidine kinase
MTVSGPRCLPDAHHRRKAARPSSEAVRAKALEESKRSFLRMVSHELRTPLNSIIGFSEIIASELHGPMSEPRYRAHAEIILDSGHRLLKLVNQIMEIARLEAGACDLDIRAESPRAAADEVVHAMMDEAASRGVLLRLETIEPLPQILADARGLKTILTNLLRNAVTHAPAGSEVTVTLRRRGREVAIEIRDHGAGIAPKDLARVMQPFEQGESALTRSSQGAGLGLSIVKLLCDAMNGHLRLRPTPGGGLTASVRLPIAAAAAGTAA